MRRPFRLPAHLSAADGAGIGRGRNLCAAGAWNEYLYQFLLLSSPRNKTVAITIAEFFENDNSPWNYMVAAALIYSLPPIAIFFAVRRYIAAGLTMGSVKG